LNIHICKIFNSFKGKNIIEVINLKSTWTKLYKGYDYEIFWNNQFPKTMAERDIQEPFAARVVALELQLPSNLIRGGFL